MQRLELQTPLLPALKILSVILGWLVFLIGLVSFIGWFFDTPFLFNLSPAFPPIAPNTTVLLMASGIAACLLTESKRARKRRSAIMLLSFFILSASALIYIEYLLDVNLGIDFALFPDKIQIMSIPGRMSLQSILCFMAIGSSFIFFHKKIYPNIYVSQFLALIAGIISFIALLGYLYDLPHLYTIAPFKGISIITATSFFMLFLSVLLARPDQMLTRPFINEGIGAYVSRRLFAGLIVLGVMDVLIMTAGKNGWFSQSFAPILHLWLVVSVFVYLIYIAFNSLDKVAQMEQMVVHLKKVDKIKDEFISTASHQLRTPLSIVSWNSEMLLGQRLGKITPKQREYLEGIANGNQQMTNLVNDLLNTTRIDIGKLPINPRPTKIRQVVKDLLRNLAMQSQTANVTLAAKVDDMIPEMVIDPDLLYAVLENLVVNAIRYNRPGGKVTIDAKNQTEGVWFRVADTGMGIPKKQHKKIFSKLFRADNVRKKYPDGTGLGLYIAKAIVQQHRGKIWFVSKEGKGTEFFFTLYPLKQSEKITNH